MTRFIFFFKSLFWKFFNGDKDLILFNRELSEQEISIRYSPSIDFLGMFSDGKFMSGFNTKTYIPWNSPFFLSDFYISKINKALFLGGGACVNPTALYRRSSAEIDIVEINPIFIDLANKYFFLPQNKKIKSHIQDAESFIFETSSKYDAIFFDIGFSFSRKNHTNFKFSEDLKTLKKMKEILTPGGILVFVVISKRVGRHKKFLKSIERKMNKIFSLVEFYADKSNNPEVVQSNIFVVGKNKTKINKLLLNKSGKWGDYYKEAIKKKCSI